VNTISSLNVADAGTPINPRIVETQLAGAALMQLGFTLGNLLRGSRPSRARGGTSRAVPEHAPQLTLTKSQCSRMLPGMPQSPAPHTVPVLAIFKTALIASSCYAEWRIVGYERAPILQR
jgi:hypothetical protein